MALSTFKLNRILETRRHYIREFVATPNATAGQGYNATNGEALDFTAATNPNGLPRRMPPSKPLPTEDDITIDKVPLGFTAEIKQAASSPTLKNFVLRIANLSTGAELTTADYPAGVGGKDIVFRVTSRKSLG